MCTEDEVWWEGSNLSFRCAVCGRAQVLTGVCQLRCTLAFKATSLWWSGDASYSLRHLSIWSLINGTFGGGRVGGIDLWEEECEVGQALRFKTFNNCNTAYSPCFLFVL